MYRETFLDKYTVKNAACQVSVEMVKRYMKGRLLTGEE
jgi:hypothetical protein